MDYIFVSKGAERMSEITIDNNVLDKAKNGDVESFEILIKQYEKLLFNISYRMLSNYEDAKDLTQDSIIKIYRHLDKCTDINSFKSWACKIATNSCIDFIRMKKRRPEESIDEKFADEEGEYEKQIDSKQPTPEQHYIAKERKAIILESINELNDKFKTVIVLRELNGLSYDEISRITNESLGTVKSRISRARSALKEILITKMEHKI